MSFASIVLLTTVVLFTSMLSGLAGLGGGTVLIALLFALGLPAEQAIPLFAAVQVVANVSRTAAYAADVRWRAAGWFLLAAVPATLLMTPLAISIDTGAVQLLLGGLILLSLLPGKADKPLMGETASFIGAGLINGLAGVFVGATGLLTGRLMLRPEWSQRTTIGTLAMTQSLGHLLRVLAFGLMGYNALAQPELLLPMSVAVVAGTWGGRRLNDYVSHEQFLRLFKLLLVLLSGKLIWDGARTLLAGA